MIQRAVLSWYVFENNIRVGLGSDPINAPKSIYRITENWQENSITWNNQPGFNGTALYDNMNTDTAAWEDFTVTSAIKNMVENGRANYGFMVKFPIEDGYLGAQIYSSEASNISLRPKLTLDILTSGTMVATPVFSVSGGCTEVATVTITCATSGASIYYTNDGSTPTKQSTLYTGSLTIREGSLTARAFKTGATASPINETLYLLARRAVTLGNVQTGIVYRTYNTDTINYSDTPIDTGVTTVFDLSMVPNQQDAFALDFVGYINVPQTDEYLFYTRSDDGSCLYIDTTLVVDNGGPHPGTEKNGSICLQKGYHPIRVTYYNGGGGSELSALWTSSTFFKEFIPASVLFHTASQQTDVAFPVTHQKLSNSLMVKERFNAISYTLPRTAKVELVIYNTTGKIMQTLNNLQVAGAHTVQLENNLVNGHYFYRLKACGQTRTDKMIVIR